MSFTAPVPKPLLWVGSSKKDLQALPADVQDSFGYALHLAQTGDKHPQAKPLKGFGSAGVLEVVESEAGSTYRAVYTVKVGVSIDPIGTRRNSGYASRTALEAERNASLCSFGCDTGGTVSQPRQPNGNLLLLGADSNLKCNTLGFNERGWNVGGC